MTDDRDGRGSGRRRLDSVIPEILKRAVEKSVERAPDNLRNFVSELKVPKEIVQVILAQIDESKNDLFRVVAKEVREFLEHTNFTGELEKLLTTVQFEVNTTIRFRPNSNVSNGTKSEAASASEGADKEPLPKPEVTTSVSVKREGERERERRRRPRNTDGGNQ